MGSAGPETQLLHRRAYGPALIVWDALMRSLIACTIALAVPACVAPQGDPPEVVIENGATVYAANEETAAVPGGSVSPLDRAATVSIKGCCSITAPAVAVVRQPVGQVIDGFGAITVSAGDETVIVEPLLGSYGWLEAEGGLSRMVDRRPAREATLLGGRMIVVPLQTSIDGRTNQMTLRVMSDCTTGACPLLQSVEQSMQIEERWSAQ